MSTHLIAMQQKNKSKALGKLSDSYRTPPWLFRWLDNEYDFDFDICASDENHLCGAYYTEENSYIGRNWSELGSVGFCNPPFSRGHKEAAFQNAYENLQRHGVSSVFLIPSDVSNNIWLDHIIGKATKITIIVGRVKFCDPVNGEETKNGLGCAVVEFMHGEQPCGSNIQFVRRDDIRSQYD